MVIAASTFTLLVLSVCAYTQLIITFGNSIRELHASEIMIRVFTAFLTPRKNIVNSIILSKPGFIFWLTKLLTLSEWLAGWVV